MKKYYYCVNTFKNEEPMPIQLSGYIEAESEEDAIQELIKKNIIDSHGYEFLDLKDEINHVV